MNVRQWQGDWSSFIKNSAFQSGVKESHFFTYCIKIEILHCNVQYKGTDNIFECHCTKSSFDMTLWLPQCGMEYIQGKKIQEGQIRLTSMDS